MPEGVHGAFRGLWSGGDKPAATQPQRRPISSNRPQVVETLASTNAEAEAAVPMAAEESPAVIQAVSYQQEVNPATGSTLSGADEIPFSFGTNAPEEETVWQKRDNEQFPASIISSDADSLSIDQLEKELDHLGATYFRLESWGSQPRTYQFHCTVMIKIGMAEYSRRFESTAGTPAQAMQNVRNLVVDWHQRFHEQVPASQAIPMGHIPR